MKVKAHAKINICLNVVCRRDDGYHELEMIMVPLMLHDELTITLSSEDCYTCSDAQLRMDETNTIVQAVELMRRTFSLSECFHEMCIRDRTVSVPVSWKRPLRIWMAGMRKVTRQRC